MALRQRNYIGFIIGVNSDGKPVVVHFKPNCLVPAIGMHDNEVGFIVGNNTVVNYRGRCNDDNTKFITGENYIGFIVGQKSDGTFKVISECGECDNTFYSGSTRQNTILACPSGFCPTISIPPEGFVLSINTIGTLFGLPLPTGDFQMTYLTGLLVAQELDEFCDEVSQTYGDGYYSDLYYIGNNGNDHYIRYGYDPCTGNLTVLQMDTLGDCPDKFQIQTNVYDTLDISACDPYYADISDAFLIASVSI